MPVRSRRREVCPLLTPAQVAAILSACATRDAASGKWSGSLRNRLLFAVLAETGMRLGEVLCLTHADWHPGSGGTPFIQVVPRDHPHGARVKGGRGRRIYISDELERLYGDYLWELAERAGQAGREVSDEWFCFVNLDREPRFAPLRPERVYRITDRLRQVLPGLPGGWSPHWLRHTHASALQVSGVASSASFGSFGERALPGPQRVALRRSQRDGTRFSARDLGRQQQVASDAWMRHLIRLQEVTVCCSQGNVQERSEGRSGICPVAG